MLRFVSAMQYHTALVTGGSGFIGSHLVDALVQRGIRVVVVDKVDPPAERKNSGATYVRCNIQDAAMHDICKNEQPEILFHLAAHIDDRESLREPVANAEDNILGSLNVFEAARLVNVKKIIFASTGVVYGATETLPTSETTTPSPLTPYGVSKLTGERYLNFYWGLYKMPYVALRLSNVYGPRQDASKECGVIAIYTKRLLAGESIIRNNDGTTTRDYVYVDDVVSAMLSAVEHEAVGVYNVGTGKETSTNEVLTAITATLDVTPEVTDRPDVADMVKRVVLDSRLAAKDLAWQPKVSFADGLARTIDWYKAQL